MTDISIEPLPAKPPRNKWLDIWTQLGKHKGAMLGGGFLLFITLGVLFGPYIWTIDPQKIDIRNRDLRPIFTALFDSDAKVRWANPLGTDQLGRDGLANLMAGGRASMAVGWTAMLLTLGIGTIIGVVAGYFKRLDGPLMRLTDLFLSLPILPLLLVAVTLFREPLRASFGPEGGMFILIVSIIGITSWMPTARIVRGDVLALKEREFVLAARSIGTTQTNMIKRHILPNVLSPIMVSATLGLATAIITESALSFLGVGFPSDFPTWGKMLADAVDRMENFPERVLWPGLAISLTVLSVNYLGDGLRDALDPRIRGR
ncbi:ABC transporter permease [Phaeobacter gallaeciensis]|jgi:peptide/nickel transport system permease protein|uniref:ABC transporter permease n=2 Tax=Roseobacteraceae TaxID=2854170 RepID=A0A366WRW8_9RHOB|nr:MULTISPECIES: ABC transporter permease [Roseobacteraceae]MBT3143009.1 ABC transporter permease [Falsiruegeria litorea]MBT8166886.1 ABC transporter permease [Falsiruegeria litorea]RBW51541.1 ABC transporter permease [Phaeobacter gallaeciensis]